MDYKQVIIDAGLRMYNSGFTVDTFGNISVMSEIGLVYITPTSIPYTEITKDDVCVLDLDGNIIDGGKRPSSEYRLHLEIYKARPDIKAIVHTHPIDSTAISCTGADLPMLFDEAWIVLKDTVKTVKYNPPGTIELAKAAAEAMKGKSQACLLQSHGAVCCGKDINAAFRTAEIVEMTAKIYIRVKSMGCDYLAIDDCNPYIKKYFEQK